MNQWIRECRLIGVDDGSKGLDFSELRIEFDVRKTSTRTPNEAKIRIHNLSRGTAKKAKQEFKRIQLKAGYRGASDVIFDGTIREARMGKDGTDRHLDILAGDGDQPYIQATVNKSLAAGCSLDDVFRASVTPMMNCGAGSVSLGHIDCFDPVTFPRGRVLYGMSRDIIDQVCRTSHKDWSIQNGKLQVVNRRGSLPTAFVISKNTGMIGAPEEVNEGVKVKCLLNPKLLVDGQVKIESENISGAAASSNGFYRILQLDIVGDTHGNDWYSEMTCVAMDKLGGNTTD
jgi:hypothetical protein